MPAGVYVGTDDGLYVLRPTERLDLPGRRLRSLVDDGSTVWAVVGDSEVYKAGVAGIWRHVIRVRNATVTCIYPSPAGVLIGTAGAHLYRWRSHRLEPVESFELIEGRTKWHTPTGDPPSVRSIGIDHDGTIFVSVYVGGIMRSTDDCATWQPMAELTESVQQAIVLPGADDPLLAATERGLSTSWDHVKKWNHRALGLDGPYCSAVAVCDDTVLVCASEGPDARRAALYRGSLEGVRFERCGEGAPELDGNLDPACLSGAGQHAVVGTPDGSVYLSSDAGRTWDVLAEGLPPVRCVLVRP
ncbi:MAG TPA: hypothetical protein VIL34_18790 [Actinopolymorphaceae bacterium]|jgi:hypothetical protein